MESTLKTMLIVFAVFAAIIFAMWTIEGGEVIRQTWPFLALLGALSVFAILFQKTRKGK